MATLDPSQKFALITKNLAEVLNPELIEQVLAERDLKVYWGADNLLCSLFETNKCQELHRRAVLIAAVC
jgi:hypothetical protein